MALNKTHNRLTWVARVVAVVGLIGILASCAPQGDSPQDLTRSFVSDIQNRNYGSIQSLLDSSATSYSTANTSKYWQTHFPTVGEDYSITSISGDGPVTAVIAGSGNSTSSSYTFTFSGSEGSLFEPSNYKIRTITRGSTTIFN